MNLRRLMLLLLMVSTLRAEEVPPPVDAGLLDPTYGITGRHPDHDPSLEVETMGAPRDAVLPIYIDRQAFLHAIHAMRMGKKKSVGGLLVGQPVHTEHGDILRISGFVKDGKNTGDRDYRVSRARLVELRDRMVKPHPRADVVGWFFTRPQGQLAVENDQIEDHDELFPHDWQVIMVGDPVRNAVAFFQRMDGDLIDTGFRVVSGERRGRALQRIGKKGGKKVTPGSSGAKGSDAATEKEKATEREKATENE